MRRTSLLADTAQQLALRPAHQLKRPLRVSFISNGLHEEGVDQGGVSREFFQLLVGGWVRVGASEALHYGSARWRVILVGCRLGDAS